MKKIKILTITTSGLWKKEGISTVILDYYSLFDKKKFDLEIIASGEYGYELVSEFQNIGVTIRCLPSRKSSLIKYIKAYINLLRNENYDVLYIHGSSAIMSIELILAQICGVKVRVVHSHNTTCDHKKADKFLRPIFYRTYTKALACGQDAGKWLYGGRDFELVRNGRSIERYSFKPEVRQMLRQSLGINDSTLVIGHVGNFNNQKNQMFLINVFNEIVKLNSDSKLFLMGTGTTLDSVKQLVNDLDLKDKVIFTGSISNVPDMLQAMDVMVLPSLHEGLPLVVVEWQIAALPCLISDKVTKECAYTDLVKFMPLEKNYRDWAEKIIEMKCVDRSEKAIGAIKLTQESGYDINTNAIKLQELFEQECRN